MATSMLRLGRLGTLKCLQQDGWGSVRTPLTAAFCTKTEAPKKPAKKASSKTLEAPDERAALLAHKTTVAFPARLSPPGLLSQGVALGEYEQSGKPVSESAAAAGASTVESAPSTSQVSCEAPSKESNTTNTKETKLVTEESAKAETESCDVGTASDATPIEQDTSPNSADVEAQNNDASSSSSSSSSSDSDSDSDSDDEKPDKTEMTKPVFQTEDKVGQEKMPSAVREEPPSDVKTPDVSEHVQPSVPGRFRKGSLKGSPAGAPVGSPVATSAGSPVGRSVRLAVDPPNVAFEVSETLSKPKTTSEKVPASCKAVTSSEETVDPAPVLCATKSIKLQPKSIPENEANLELKCADVSHAIPKPVCKGAPEAAADCTSKVVLDSANEVASEPKVETEAAPETTEAVAAAEDLMDAAPVITEAEEVQAEPDAAAAPEEAPAAPAAPAPEPEPFDNTTYKNLQHHNYNTCTFVDVDVEMAKYRLPQPSTGRTSPRH